MRVNIGLVHILITMLEFLLVIIPIKLIAANFVGKSELASAAYATL